MISKRFSVVSACNLCLETISKFINKPNEASKKKSKLQVQTMTML